MSRLRKAIQSEQQAYASARYGGDLGELVQAEPPRPGVWRGAAIGLAIAATLLLALIPAQEDPTPQPRQPLAQSSNPPGIPSNNQTKLPPPTPRLTQAAAYAVRVDEPRVLVRRRPLKPLRFFNTEPRITVAATTAAAANSSTTATPTKPTGKTRRRDFSTRSLALRSMKNGIRFGT